MLVVLIGLRGSGKSSVGAALAAELSTSHIDLDERVQARFSGKNVRDIWRQHGEQAWRDAEADELSEVLSDAHTGVLSLGGGTPEIASSRALLDQRKSTGEAMIIYLRLGVDKLIARLAADPGDRPPLTTLGHDDEVAATWQRRDPIYRTLASHVIDVGDEDATTLAQHIASLVVRLESAGVRGSKGIRPA